MDHTKVDPADLIFLPRTCVHTFVVSDLSYVLLSVRQQNYFCTRLQREQSSCIAKGKRNLKLSRTISDVNFYGKSSEILRSQARKEQCREGTAPRDCFCSLI